MEAAGLQGRGQSGTPVLWERLAHGSSDPLVPTSRLVNRVSTKTLTTWWLCSSRTTWHGWIFRPCFSSESAQSPFRDHRAPFKQSSGDTCPRWELSVAAGPWQERTEQGVAQWWGHRRPGGRKCPQNWSRMGRWAQCRLPFRHADVFGDISSF